jgi:hypothetical protein
VVQGSYVASTEASESASRPAGWFFYLVLIGTTSLLTAFDGTHAFSSLLQRAHVPAAIASAVTGLFNLSWYELSYVVGGALRSVTLFLILPYIGSATGLLSAVSMLGPRRFRRSMLFVHFGVSLSTGVLSLAVLSWRFMRGYNDFWRTTATVAFLFAYYVWIEYFRSTDRPVGVR